MGLDGVDRDGAEPDAHNEWTWVLALIALGFILFDVWYLTREPRVRAPAPAGGEPRAPRPPPRDTKSDKPKPSSSAEKAAEKKAA